MLRLIGEGEARRVLEVGSGCGTEALFVALKGASVTGIDISRELLAVAEQRQHWLEAAIGERLDCHFEYRSVLAMAGEPFDLVYLEQAFHHLEPRSEVIPRLAALVKPGGRLVISETNGWNPLVQLQLFRRRGFRTISTHEGHPWGHERITVPRALIRHFAPLGFRRESLGYYRTLPNTRAADRLQSAERLLPGFARPLFTNYNLVLRKA